MQARHVLVAPAGIARRLRVHEEQLLVAGDVERDHAVLGVGVHGVEDVAGVDVEPADVGVAAAPRHDAELGAALGLPREEAAALREVLEVENTTGHSMKIT